MPRKKAETKKTTSKKKAPVTATTAVTPPLEPKPKKNRSKNVIIIALIIFFVLAIFVAFSYYYQSKIAVKYYSSTEDETYAIVSKISQFMDLPKDEIPTLATVLDKNKLIIQPFFQNAQNGDKLLIYEDAKQAIIYRPSTNRIIGVAPITTSQDQQEQSQEIKVAYYNGTTASGFASEAEKKVVASYPNYKTLKVSNAFYREYTKPLIVDITGGHGKEVENIIKLIGGTSGSLPDGETKPNADILVILGK